MNIQIKYLSKMGAKGARGKYLNQLSLEIFLQIFDQPNIGRILKKQNV